MITSVVKPWLVLAYQVLFPEQPAVGVIVHVHETGRDYPAGGINDLCRIGLAEVTDCCDPIAPDPHVPSPARRTGPAYDGSTSDDNVVHAITLRSRIGAKFRPKNSAANLPRHSFQSPLVAALHLRNLS